MPLYNDMYQMGFATDGAQQLMVKDANYKEQIED
jgi:hypothetical protein